MKTIIANLLLFFALVFLPQQAVIAIERLSAAEPALQFEPVREQSGGGGGMSCARCIQGFIDSAVVTAERVTTSDQYRCNHAA